MSYYAHSGRCKDFTDWQMLAEHLRNVSNLASGFAEEARPGDTEFMAAARAS
jgi:hypothetical protein